MAVSVDRENGVAQSKELEKQFHDEIKKMGVSEYVYRKFKNPDRVIINTKKDKGAR
jgi:hypothetical protein